MRHVESLFSPPAPPELLGGAELHLIEYHHLDSDTNWRTATMVVNFDDTPVARQTFSALRSTFVSARYSIHVFSGPEGAAQMCDCLRVQPFGTADAVLYTARNRAITIETLQATVDAIRAMGRGLVVVVDDDCLRWRALQNVSGFVRGAESTSPSTAAAVAILLATLCAPETLACTDYEDVESCLGDSEQPAVLAEAIWFRRRETLEFASVADGDVAKGADSIVVNICAASLRIRDFSLILRAVGACMAPSGSLILQAPVNNSIRPWLHPSLVSLPMICLAPKSVVSLCPPADAAVTELVARFPHLFRGNEPCARSFLPLGWKQLVFELFQDIDRLLSDAQAASFETLQVKEKLGRLRIRVRYSGTVDARSDPEPRLRALVAKASDQSEAVCQICGRLNKSKHRPRLWNLACEVCCAALTGIG